MWVPPFMIMLWASPAHQLWVSPAVGFTSCGLSSSYLLHDCFSWGILCVGVWRGVCVLKGAEKTLYQSAITLLLTDLFNLSFSTQQGTGGGHPPKHPALRGPGSPHTPHHLLPPHHRPGISSPNQLSVPPDPFNRKVSRHPKKFLTQSSSRFQPQKPPPDYKPLPHLKGRICVAIFMAHGQSNGIACASQLYLHPEAFS